MNGHELEKKYGITITNHSLFLECSDMCICGHHASVHHGMGSGGKCDICMPPLQNGMYYPFAHNFVPVDASTMNYETWMKTTGKKIDSLGNTVLMSEDEKEDLWKYKGKLIKKPWWKFW